MTSRSILFAAALLPVSLMAQMSGSGSGPKGADLTFATMAAQSDVAELQISNLALQKSSDEQVKKIAQQLIDDHTKTSDAMKQIASSQGFQLPAEPDAKHQALAQKLQSESGAQFDKDYLAANVADHHKVLAAFEKESNSGTNPDIKAFATKFLPDIQKHTKMLEQSKSSSM